MDLLTSRQFLDDVRRLIAERASPRNVQFVNANKIAKIAEDKAFQQLMWRADYVLTDGQPMVPLARLLGIRVPERIDGIGLMHKLLQLADEQKYRVYLFGAKQEIIDACVARIQTDLPHVVIAGYRNGYFQRDELPAIAAAIKATQPDLLFLGLGSPMKEEMADQFREQFGATIIQGVGGSFDVMAGLVKRSPVWLQRLGLEWLYRVWQEPRRMFWRYAVTNAVCLRVFVGALVRRLLGQSPPQTPGVVGQLPG